MEKKDINEAREWTKLFLGIILAAFGMGTVIFSLLVPPVGAIHASVITVFGTILTFVGAIFGIDSNAKIRIHEQDVEFENRTRQQQLDFELRSRELDDRMRKFETRMKQEEED